MSIVYNDNMSNLDKALAKRKKQNEIQMRDITHRAIIEPEKTKSPKLKNQKRGQNVIRNTRNR